jgi:hypothetical protein
MVKSKKMKEKIIRQTGTALLITLLLAGVISAIAFGMTKITLNEVFVGMKGQEGLEAQYAAQAGVEDALMRYKFHDKTSLEMPDGARGGTNGTNNVVRVYLNKPLVTNVPVSNRPPANADDYYYDLKVWHKQDCQADSCEYELKKDESISLDTSDITGTIGVTWNLYNANDRIIGTMPAIEAKKTGLWYRLSDPADPSLIDPTNQSREFFTFLNLFDTDPTTTDPRFSQPGIRISRGTTGAFLSTRSARSLKFKAFISDTLNGAYIKITIASTPEAVGGPKTYIESTGHYGDTAKKIEVTVDRESKSIIDVFDYVIYSGDGPLPK